MESIGHRVIVHTNKEDFICYEKLAELQKRLDPAFVICHKSFLVNMEEISRIDKDKIELLYCYASDGRGSEYCRRGSKQGIMHARKGVDSAQR